MKGISVKHLKIYQLLLCTEPSWIGWQGARENKFFYRYCFSPNSYNDASRDALAWVKVTSFKIVSIRQECIYRPKKLDLWLWMTNSSVKKIMACTIDLGPQSSFCDIATGMFSSIAPCTMLELFIMYLFIYWAVTNAGSLALGWIHAVTVWYSWRTYNRNLIEIFICFIL